MAAPVFGSQIALYVKSTSLVVSGLPSDHLRPLRSLIVTSMWVSSIFLTSPLSVVGMSLTRSGMGLFCGSKTHNDDQIGPLATSWVVAAVLEMTFRS